MLSLTAIRGVRIGLRTRIYHAGKDLQYPLLARFWEAAILIHPWWVQIDATLLECHLAILSTFLNMDCFHSVASLLESFLREQSDKGIIHKDGNNKGLVK